MKIFLSFFLAIVESVSLTSSTLPNKGFLTVTIDNKNKIVCSEASIAQTKDIVCRQLGYWRTLEESSAVSGKRKEDMFQGRINCNGEETTLSQCPTESLSNDCTKQSYVTCKFETLVARYNRTRAVVYVLYVIQYILRRALKKIDAW